MKGNDLVGPQEIAEGLRVSRATVHAWRYRGLLPPPEWVISGVPIWRWSVIETWADDTGRLKGAQ